MHPCGHAHVHIPTWGEWPVPLHINSLYCSVLKLALKGHEELVNEHYKEPVKRQVDDMMASVLKAVVSNISGSNMEVNIGK